MEPYNQILRRLEICEHQKQGLKAKLKAGEEKIANLQTYIRKSLIRKSLFQRLKGLFK